MLEAALNAILVLGGSGSDFELWTCRAGKSWWFNGLFPLSLSCPPSAASNQDITSASGGLIPLVPQVDSGGLGLPVPQPDSGGLSPPAPQ